MSHSTKRTVIAPRSDQDGWVYVRVSRELWDEFECWKVAYKDSLPCSRTVSSLRVEEALETMEYLEKCYEAGYVVRMTGSRSWTVSRCGWNAWGKTLKAAYYILKSDGRV